MQGEFLLKFKDILDTKDDITGEMKLSDIVEWDSIARMGVIALADRYYGTRLTREKLMSVKTVNELFEIVANG